MQINRLKIDKLYGYINKDIEFNTDITLLVGINGSGKTSILNILNWIINPSIPSLCITEFKSLKLWITLKKMDYEITCEHIEKKFHYKIKSKKKDYHPLIVTIDKNPKDIQNDTSLKNRLINGYNKLTPENDEEQETWDLIRSFPTPTIIGLDRNLYAEESINKIYLEDSDDSNSRKKSSSTKSPLDRVKDIVNVEYRKRKNEVSNLTNSLKNQLMLSAFDGSITLETLINLEEKYKIKPNDITRAENRINDYFQNFEKESLSTEEFKTITNYFKQLKEITEKFQSNPNDTTIKALYGLNAHQFIKIKKLLNEFERFELKSLKTMNDIQTYLDTVNHFLKDSAKQILFRDDTLELTFNNLDKNGKAITKFKDLNFLSSGEQQILILLSYISFTSTDGKIFIIDEPELSLHIKWQEDFLEKLEKVTPTDTQIILATHSPILANNKKEKAIVLLPYNE